MNWGRWRYTTMAITLVISAGARGESLTYHDSIPVQPTGWGYGLSVPQFEPALGTLEAIDVRFSGHIEGTAGFESLDAMAADVLLEFAADLTLTGPSAFEALAQPQVSWMASATGFDGVIDLGGASGQTWLDVVAADVVSVNVPTGFGLGNDWVGAGVVSFWASSAGNSRGSGTGNLLLQFEQNAWAGLAVTYTYSVPEPATFVAVILGVVVLQRRRRGDAEARRMAR